MRRKTFNTTILKDCGDDPSFVTWCRNNFVVGKTSDLIAASLAHRGVRLSMGTLERLGWRESMTDEAWVELWDFLTKNQNKQQVITKLESYDKY